MRKHILQSQVTAPDAREIPVTSVATVFTTSEAADHPIDHAFNCPGAPGALAGSPSRLVNKRSSSSSTAPRRSAR
jgi:hypothetical protein